MHIVLDIDETLASSDPSSIDIPSFNPYALNYQHLTKDKFFVYKTDLYLMYPGAFEFLQCLFDLPEATISFYSAGQKERNQLFVEALLSRALGEERYKQVKPFVRIYSYEDCINRDPSKFLKTLSPNQKT